MLKTASTLKILTLEIAAVLLVAGCSTQPRQSSASADRYTNIPYGSQAYYPQQAGLPPRTGYVGGSQNSDKISPRYHDWLFDGPEGMGFSYYLARGYRQFAKHEDNESDFANAERFNRKAEIVEQGGYAEPEQVGRNIPQYAVADLVNARARLMTILGQGAATFAPKLTAQAQVAFDCWEEQQEENIQQQEVHKCRQYFEAAMFHFERPAAPPSQPYTLQACDANGNPVAYGTPGAMQCMDAPRCASTYVVYFDLDKSNLTDEARKVMNSLLQAYRSGVINKFAITGHTDRAASDEYNVGLSKRRVETVSTAMFEAGVPKDSINSSYFGETKPAIQTRDGERKAENRRVEIKANCN